MGIPATPNSVCPSDAPVKSFNVVALDRPMKLNPKAPDVIEVDFERKIEMTMPEGKIFALEEEATTVSQRRRDAAIRSRCAPTWATASRSI